MMTARRKAYEVFRVSHKTLVNAIARGAPPERIASIKVTYARNLSLWKQEQLRDIEETIAKYEALLTD